MQNKPFRHAFGALGAAAVALALAACDRAPNTPNPTTDTPTSGQPASAPATTSGSLGGGSSGSPTGTEISTATGTDTVTGAGGTTATAAGSGTTGAAPSPSAHIGSPSGAGGSTGVTSSTGAAAIDGGTAAGGAGGTATDASGRVGPTEAGGTETATTMGGGAAAGVPRTGMGNQYGTADAGSVTPGNNAATVPGAGHTGGGTVAGLPAGGGQDASGAMSGGSGGTTLDGSRPDARPATGTDPAGTDASGDELRKGGNAAAMAGTHALTRAEQNFLVTAAAAGNYEIAMARLATERGESAAVTEFARALSEHRAQANRELQRLALEKGVLLPTDAPAERQQELRRLSQARGAEFDRLFMEQVGLQAQREDIALYERATREAQDPQVKAFAEKMLPRMREHHESAQRIAAAEPGGSRDAGGATRP